MNSVRKEDLNSPMPAFGYLQTRGLSDRLVSGNPSSHAPAAPKPNQSPVIYGIVSVISYLYINVRGLIPEGIAMRGPDGDAEQPDERPRANFGEGAAPKCTDQTPSSEPNHPWELLTCP